MTSRRSFFGLGHDPDTTPRGAVHSPASVLPQFDLVACSHRTDFCAVCVERCPVDSALHMGRMAPVVDLDRCTGCGVCADVCPSPFGAVLMRPVEEVRLG